MARDLRNHIRECGWCKKFEAAPPVAPLRPLACSGLGELLHVDFTSIEETVPLCEELVIRNVMVMQDHFSKYVVAYVVKDQMACTTAEMLRNGYFGLFGAPAYLVSNQGKAFTGHLISNLCELYGVQKLRTSPYHAQTNGQVERMNQTIIRMIGKLEQDKKAHWSEHLPEMLAAYNGTCSAVTGYSPYFLLFGRKSRMPVRPMWPGTRGWAEKVQVPQLVNRRLPASPQVTSLGFTRQQHSLPPLVDWMMILNTLKVPHLMRIVTPRRLNLLPRKMRVCTYPVTLRRLYRTILFCRSRWPVPCESRR